MPPQFDYNAIASCFAEKKTQKNCSTDCFDRPERRLTFLMISIVVDGSIRLGQFVSTRLIEQADAMGPAIMGECVCIVIGTELESRIREEVSRRGCSLWTSRRSSPSLTSKVSDIFAAGCCSACSLNSLPLCLSFATRERFSRWKKQ